MAGPCFKYALFSGLVVAVLCSVALCYVDPCVGHRHAARGTGYYPHNDSMEGGFVDMHGVKLRTLQDFLQGNASYVSVAMDNKAGIPYGTPVCIPEMNKHWKKNILFRVVDTGGAFIGKKFSRIDICVRTRQDTFDKTINGPLTLVFKSLYSVHGLNMVH